MNKEDAIRQFAERRPESNAIYGYGSGVFKQASSGTKPLTDVIFVVDDLKKWHMDNMQINPKDYSMIGRIYINNSSVEKIKGVNGATYFSEIKDGEYTFKYGVIEVLDFVRGLNTWDNMFMAGRFHKPVLEIDSQKAIRDSIDYNRKCAFMIACLFSEPVCTAKEILVQLCGLSYLGDARMAIAENPRKVEEIVEGSFDKLMEIYPFIGSFITKEADDIYFIDHGEILRNIEFLPKDLLDFFKENDTNINDIDMVRIDIYEFLKGKNSVESRAQILQGVRTNGIIRSVPYVLAKVKKRFSR